MHHSCSPRERIVRLEAGCPRFVFSVARRHFSVSCVLLSMLTTRLTEMSCFKVVLNFVLPRCLVRATRLRSPLFYIRLPLLSLTMYYAHIAPVPPFPDVSRCVKLRLKKGQDGDSTACVRNVTLSFVRPIDLLRKLSPPLYSLFWL